MLFFIPKLILLIFFKLIPNIKKIIRYFKDLIINSSLKNILKPILIKISPDISALEISKLIEIILKYKIDGIIVSNTTDRNRDNLLDNQKNEKGGLSGRPLKDISTDITKKFYQETKGKIKIIGVGGVDTGRAAFEKICAGANAVQLYTGMVYRGPRIASKISKELIDLLKNKGFKNVSEAIGTKI